MIWPKEVELVGTQQILSQIDHPLRYIVVFHEHCTECGYCKDVIYDYQYDGFHPNRCPTQEEIRNGLMALAVTPCQSCAIAYENEGAYGPIHHCSRHAAEFSPIHPSFLCVTREGEKVWAHPIIDGLRMRSTYEFTYKYQCGHSGSTAVFKATLEIAKHTIRDYIKDECCACRDLCNIYPELIECYSACVDSFEDDDKKTLEKIIIKSFTATLKEVKDKNHAIWFKKKYGKERTD